MRSIKTFVGTLSVTLAFGLLSAACGSGYSTQESNQTCKDDLKARNIPNDEEAFKACVVCYEQCTDCKAATVDNKLTYACPVDE